jgi:hypothetical protein
MQFRLKTKYTKIGLVCTECPKSLEPMGIELEGEAQWNGHHDHLTLTHWTPWIPEGTQEYAVEI